jgi:ABC-type transporter Mla subunit MlaD
MADAMTTMKNKVSDVTDSINQAANTAKDNLKTAAGNVADQAKRTAATLSAEGQQAASYIGQRADEYTDAFGTRLKSAGDAIRQNAPQDGPIGQASSTIARSLEDTGDYLQREGLGGIASDMSTIIKKNPIPSLLFGIGIGYLLAQATKSRS